MIINHTDILHCPLRARALTLHHGAVSAGKSTLIAYCNWLVQQRLIYLCIHSICTARTTIECPQWHLPIGIACAHSSPVTYLLNYLSL